jgi:Fe(3+) dicitrate transport protein
MHRASLRRPLRSLAIAGLVALLLALPLGAADDDQVAEPVRPEAPVALVTDAGVSAPAPPETVTVFERLMVIGGPDRLVEIPGSAHHIEARELERQSHTDLHRILRIVPGVNLQDEEGYGLRPHIGMRGSGIERSQKITLLEDGVPIAPAPYSAPAAYYVPTAARMSGFEVVKGAASVRQGPFTTGGVLNMLSADYPFQLGGRLRASLGDHATLRLHGLVGDSRERYSWMLEGFRFQTDGFKRLDGGGDTGVELTDFLGKVRFTSSPASPTYQAFELKVGRTDQLGQETYLGLTRADFERTPLRRYAASAADTIDTLHEQYQARYYLQRSGSPWDLTATLYRNEFFRNWQKLQSVRGKGLAAVLDDPERYPAELAILRGEADSAAGELALRNNRRDYYSQGLETVLGWRLGGERVRHDLEIGVRVHQDAEDRFQEDDRWQMLSGRMVLTALGAPGSQDNRVSSADAVAFFVQDRIRAGRFVLRPGVRYEHIDFTRESYGTNDPERRGHQLQTRENQVRVWVPGLGVDYLLTDSSSVFFGVHRGFAPPGPGATQETRPEESLSYEVGFRRVGEPFDFDLIGFYSDYSNLLGRDTLSSGGGGTGDLFNGGKVVVHGVETSLGHDLAPALGLSSLSIPARTAYTWTRSEFRSSFETSFADWAPRVERGDRMPYLPEHQLHASLGVERPKWSVNLAGTWTDAMRTAPGGGPISAVERTDSYLVLDLSTAYELSLGLRLELQVRNLTDETYVAALRPAGARPGLPRTAFLGFNWGF